MAHVFFDPAGAISHYSHFADFVAAVCAPARQAAGNQVLALNFSVSPEIEDLLPSG